MASLKFTLFNDNLDGSAITNLEEKGVVVKFAHGFYDYAFLSLIPLHKIVTILSPLADNSATLLLDDTSLEPSSLEALVKQVSDITLVNKVPSADNDARRVEDNSAVEVFTKGIFDAVVFHSDSVSDLGCDVMAYSRLELQSANGSITCNQSLPNTASTSHRSTIEKTIYSKEDAEQYARATYDIAVALDACNPTMIYAPVRGAKPIVDFVLHWRRLLGRPPLPIHYPVTSSFVRRGRSNNITELERMKKEVPELCQRIAYIDELNSGGMIAGHYKEMMQVFGDDITVRVFGLANNNGRNINPNIVRKFLDKYANPLGIFPVAHLVTMDHRVFLTTHFTDYGAGPHTVPYLNGREYPFVRQAFYKQVAEKMHDMLKSQVVTGLPAALNSR